MVCLPKTRSLNIYHTMPEEEMLLEGYSLMREPFGWVDLVQEVVTDFKRVGEELRVLLQGLDLIV